MCDDEGLMAFVEGFRVLINRFGLRAMSADGKRRVADNGLSHRAFGRTLGDETFRRTLQGLRLSHRRSGLPRINRRVRAREHDAETGRQSRDEKRRVVS